MHANHLNMLNNLNCHEDESKIFFMYFGSDCFDEKVNHHNYYDEGYFYHKLSNNKSHPNIFRGEIVREFLNNNDSYRHLGNYGIGNPIVLNKYHAELLNYKYNINVLGFRYSIPNRFMDSFISGAKILTDNLYVQWYVNFDDYVYQIGEVGYREIKDDEKNNI